MYTTIYHEPREDTSKYHEAKPSGILCALVVYQHIYYMCLNHQSYIFYLYHVNLMLMPAIEKMNDAGGISADKFIPPAVWGYIRSILDCSGIMIQSHSIAIIWYI